jgi:uncharacterized oxidoreductase
MPTFAVEPLTDATAQILAAAGAPDDIAAKVSRWLVNANLSGHPSHGVIRVSQYLDHIASGTFRPAERPQLRADTDTTVLMEGGGAFGHLAAEELTIRLVEKARMSHVAIGGIVRCNHIGRLGEWSELAASMGSILIMTAGGPGMMRTAPFDGREGRMSTNPISFGAPAGEAEPIIMDFATTAAAEGKIRVARDKGVEIPPGQILNSAGEPSTNPNDLYDGGVMLPFGGHKGYGLMLLSEILASNLIGDTVLSEPSSQIGTFAIAIDPDAFGAGDRFISMTDGTINRVKNTAPAEGFSEVLVPGDVERQSRLDVTASGIELPDATWSAVLDSAASVGLDRDAVAATAAG